MDENRAVVSLAALAQGMGLRGFRTLFGSAPDGLTPGVLALTLGVNSSTLSFHLKELLHAGLVSQERDGRNLIYRPSLRHMTDLLDYLTAHCCEATGGSCDMPKKKTRPATSSAH
jgi:DNA-binding transcriptional ArsR family regulator